ncbi:Uncharacterised protein [Candidatus Anstonella stagnisolia]|nr:Uncharacterised protein [Candidatus Anstonella stagnisolia]
MSALEVVKQEVPKVVSDDAIVKRAAALLINKKTTVDTAVTQLLKEGKKAHLDDARVRGLIQTRLIDTGMVDAGGNVLQREALFKLGGNEFTLAIKDAAAAARAAAEATKEATKAQLKATGTGIKAGAVGVKVGGVKGWKIAKKATPWVAGAVVAGLATIGGVEVYNEVTGSKAKSMGPTVQPVAPVQKSFQEEISDYIKEKVKPSEQERYINHFSTFEGTYTSNQVKNWVDETLQMHPNERK